MLSYLLLLPFLSILTILATVLFTWLVMVIITSVLVLVTWIQQVWRRRRFRQQHPSSTTTQVGEDLITDSSIHRQILYSGLFCGRVRHTRFHPRCHSFSYPLFIFMIDLEEADDLFRNRDGLLWPLSMVLSFRVEDHLKHCRLSGNHQSRNNNDNNNKNVGTNSKSIIQNSKDLLAKIFELVTQNKDKQISISSATHRVLLVTQLRYWGYCFNPVSFYYIQNKNTHQIDAMVAEVSNTPWNEMYHYVLDQPVVALSMTKPDDSKKHSDTSQVVVSATTPPARNYKFHKTFHVSPFMEMYYLYDWTFREKSITHEHSVETIITNLDVVTSMRDITKKDRLQFTAHMQVQRATSSSSSSSKDNVTSMMWWSSSLEPIWSFLIQYPMFCLIIQIWIHYEAFWLFFKGIPYIPHPLGSETTASRVIGRVMTPLFAIQDRWKAIITRNSCKTQGRGKAE